MFLKGTYNSQKVPEEQHKGEQISGTPDLTIRPDNYGQVPHVLWSATGSNSIYASRIGRITGLLFLNPENLTQPTIC